MYIYIMKMREYSILHDGIVRSLWLSIEKLFDFPWRNMTSQEPAELAASQTSHGHHVWRGAQELLLCMWEKGSSAWIRFENTKPKQLKSALPLNDSHRTKTNCRTHKNLSRSYAYKPNLCKFTKYYNLLCNLELARYKPWQWPPSLGLWGS